MAKRKGRGSQQEGLDGMVAWCMAKLGGAMIC